MYWRLLILFAFLSGVAFAKMSEEELNLSILQALSLQDSKPGEAVTIYKKLYDETNDKVYLKEAVKTAALYKDSRTDELMKIADTLLADDSEYLKFKMMNYIDKKEFYNAITIGEKLAKNEQNEMLYRFFGFCKEQVKDYDGALKAYEKAYEISPSEENILKFSEILLLKKNDENTAKRYLQTHQKLYGCGQNVCDLLAKIYQLKMELDDFAKISLLNYDEKGKTNYLDDAISAYFYLDKKDEIIKILEKYNYDLKTLARLYAHKKDYKKAQETALKGYEKSGDVEFLAMDAIYEYEKAGKNFTSEILKSVVVKFDAIIDKIDIALYQNYFGYVLIDHDLDVKRGISLVQKALKTEPDSVYILDSLAWGEYKLGECKKAAKIMQKISKDEDFMRSNEGKEHFEAIEKCLKKGQK